MDKTTAAHHKPTAAKQTSLTPQSIPWGPVSAVLVTIGGYFVSQLGGYLILIATLLLFGWQSSRIESWLTDSVFAQFLAILLIEGLALLILYWFLRRRKARPEQLGLVSPKWRDIAYTLAGFGAYFVLNISAVVAINMLIPAIDTTQEQELGFSTGTQGIELVFIFFSLVLLPAVVEEIFTRGFLYTGLATKLPKILAAVITSILFACAHLQFGSGNALLWIAAIDTFILSMVLVYLRDKTGSLWSPIGVHFLKNFLAFMVLFVFKT